MNQNNIYFEREYSFNDLKDKSKLRFDFAIFKDNNLIQLIEFQGEQHFKNIFGDLIKIQYRDNLKREYCKENGIKLIEIHYEKLGEITLKDLQLETY